MKINRTLTKYLFSLAIFIFFTGNIVYADSESKDSYLSTDEIVYEFYRLGHLYGGESAYAFLNSLSFYEIRSFLVHRASVHMYNVENADLQTTDVNISRNSFAEVEVPEDILNSGAYSYGYFPFSIAISSFDNPSVFLDMFRYTTGHLYVTTSFNGKTFSGYLILESSFTCVLSSQRLPYFINSYHFSRNGTLAENFYSGYLYLNISYLEEYDVVEEYIFVEEDNFIKEYDAVKEYDALEEYDFTEGHNVIELVLYKTEEE